MAKEIGSIGLAIPGLENFIEFESSQSLSDFDIVIIQVPVFYDYEIISGNKYFTGKKGKEKQQTMTHRKNEIDLFTESGKNIFVILNEYVQYKCETSREYKTKLQLINGETISNYEFLPEKISLQNSNGKKVQVKDNIFKNYFNYFAKDINYKTYAIGERKNSFCVSKDGYKTLGYFDNVNNGKIVFLPWIEYNDSEFTTTRKNGEDVRNKKAIIRGENFISKILQIDKNLKESNNKTPVPEWIEKDLNLYTKQSINIKEKIIKLNKNVEKIMEEIKQQNEIIKMEDSILDLLYEQGEPLEKAVIYGLETLGYKAQNYDDGKLELDMEITSPEGQRYIGECEGKDNKAIHIDKYRQLNESTQRDFEREDVNEKAKGLLFGNPQRLIPIEKRTEDFTEKCKIGAKGDGIGLIKTSDLFKVVKYLKDNHDTKFAQQCRDAIHNQLGGIIKFPNIPTK